MNVVLFAWCASSVAYVEALVAAGVPPRLIVTGTRCSAAAPLSALAARHTIALARCDDPNDPALLARLRDLGTDLLLVAGCARILGPALLAVPRVGALNVHPSLLPAYRGREPLFWALLRGEAQVGVTVHHLRAEVDAGPILFQRAIPVPARATSASLALRVDAEGAALIPEILALARAGALPAGWVPDEAGSQFPRLRAEHGLLDLTRSAAANERLIRACQGEIAAYVFFEEMRLVVTEAEVEPEPMENIVPGVVTTVDDGSIRVGTGNGVLQLRRFIFLNRAYGARALAEAVGICAGSRLSHNPAFAGDG